MKLRCAWVTDDPVYIAYHDEEWGEPVHDDRTLFEFLILEGAQAGLSWLTVLKRREGYRKAFDNFNVTLVASYDDEEIERLLQDERIIRNRLKVRSAVRNAKVFIRIQEEFGSFSAYLWGYVGNRPILMHPVSSADVPTRTELSDTISRDLQRRGMSFVGSTIIYAYLQAVGVVNDIPKTVISLYDRGYGQTGSHF